MTIADKRLRDELEDAGLYLERMPSRKTVWAVYTPGSFVLDSTTYNAKVSLGEDLKGRALYLIILHELAHYKADKQYGWGIRPHGKEWQAIYKGLVEKYQYLFSGVEVLSMFDRYTAKKENDLIELLSTT